MKVEDLIKTALRQPVGTPVSGDLEKQIRRELSRYTRYAKMSGSKDYQLAIHSVQWGGRRGKFVCFSNPSTGRLIPITQKSLKTPTVCPHCDKTGCAWKPNQEKMRTAIAAQITEFREQVNRKTAVCPLTGRRLSRCKTHVDHVTPFVLLTQTWAQENGVSLCQKRLRAPQLQSWADWHRENARLQLVSASGNLSKGSKILC